MHVHASLSHIHIHALNLMANIIFAIKNIWVLALPLRQVLAGWLISLNHNGRYDLTPTWRLIINLSGFPSYLAPTSKWQHLRSEGVVIFTASSQLATSLPPSWCCRERTPTHATPHMSVECSHYMHVTCIHKGDVYLRTHVELGVLMCPLLAHLIHPPPHYMHVMCTLHAHVEGVLMCPVSSTEAILVLAFRSQWAWVCTC